MSVPPGISQKKKRLQTYCSPPSSNGGGVGFGESDVESNGDFRQPANPFGDIGYASRSRSRRSRFGRPLSSCDQCTGPSLLPQSGRIGSREVGFPLDRYKHPEAIPSAPTARVFGAIPPPPISDAYSAEPTSAKSHPGQSRHRDNSPSLCSHHECYPPWNASDNSQTVLLPYLEDLTLRCELMESKMDMFSQDLKRMKELDVEILEEMQKRAAMEIMSEFHAEIEHRDQISTQEDEVPYPVRERLRQTKAQPSTHHCSQSPRTRCRCRGTDHTNMPQGKPREPMQKGLNPDHPVRYYFKEVIRDMLSEEYESHRHSAGRRIYSDKYPHVSDCRSTRGPVHLDVTSCSSQTCVNHTSSSESRERSCPLRRLKLPIGPSPKRSHRPHARPKYPNLRESGFTTPERPRDSSHGVNRSRYDRRHDKSRGPEPHRSYYPHRGRIPRGSTLRYVGHITYNKRRKINLEAEILTWKRSDGCRSTDDISVEDALDEKVSSQEDMYEAHGAACLTWVAGLPPDPRSQVRRLSLLEHHAHHLLKDFQIPVPHGFVVRSPQAASDVVYNIGAPSVLKAQILAGGRGKGKFTSDGKGGVRIVNSPDEALTNASNMLGYHLVTKQTPPSGIPVSKLYIYKSVDIAQEFYLAVTFDRERSTPVLLMSDNGGVNIESNVHQLQRFPFHLPTGLTPEIMAYIEAQFGFSDAEMQVITHILTQLVRLFRDKDATLLELNPLVRTADGSFVCLDAKLNFDDSAKFRQPELFSLEEHLPEEKDEYEAARLGLSYVRLDGDIGVIVNGAGLAMATNDLVTLCDGKCANFLDIGGGATKETLSKAFSILQGDVRTKALLINIYGGIVRCDMIAESILAAAAAMGGFRIPVVVRLQGTNCDKGFQLIRDSGLENVTLEAEFETAAEMIVDLAKRSS
ncbi:hypothetical protein FE257_004493 [Aspergillus nanangensis]|uniref:Succinate--CoA ligase [ADP-forming] subunit beta, mitochondrial n=1 Tax=Aspergillus nanangensis TaxID=2582783 RepID=A0AAD4D022_ASPNN|nr:hypothetical protein FE257_004493 [Aspergillus nanangensis]